MNPLCKWLETPLTRRGRRQEPPSPGQRETAVLELHWPAACYLVIALMFFIMRMKPFAIPFIAACLTTTFYLFHLALRPVPTCLRRENRADLLMAGMKGHQLLKGAACPIVYTLGTLIIMHYGLSILLIIFSEDSPFQGTFDAIALFFLYSTPIVALILGAMLAPSMWVLATHKLGRAIAIASLIFGWIIEFWMIYFIIFLPLMSMMLLFGAHNQVFLIVLAVSGILPGMVIVGCWCKAARKLAFDE